MTSLPRRALGARLRALTRRVVGVECLLIYRWPRPYAPSIERQHDARAQVDYIGMNLESARLAPVAIYSDYLRTALTQWPREWPSAGRQSARLHALHAHGHVLAWGFSSTAVSSWPLSETGTSLSCHPDDLLMLGFYTEPTHRGRGLYRRLLTCILSTESYRGDAFIWVQKHNAPSRRAIAAAGFSPVERHLAFRLVGVPVWRSSRRLVSPGT